MILMVIVVSAIGYGLAAGFRYYRKQQKIGLLEPPVNLLDEFKNSANSAEQSPNAGEGGGGGENEPYTNRVRYTKAQARQRFKRGKT